MKIPPEVINNPKFAELKAEMQAARYTEACRRRRRTGLWLMLFTIPLAAFQYLYMRQKYGVLPFDLTQADKWIVMAIAPMLCFGFALHLLLVKPTKGSVIERRKHITRQPGYNRNEYDIDFDRDF